MFFSLSILKLFRIVYSIQIETEYLKQLHGNEIELIVKVFMMQIAILLCLGTKDKNVDTTGFAYYRLWLITLHMLPPVSSTKSQKVCV